MPAPSTPSTVNFIQAAPFTLAGAGSSIGDVTITLSSMVGIDGNNIVTADLGSYAFGTLEPGNGTQEEAILFTGITQNANGTATLTGVSSIMFKQPYTLTTGLTKTHAGASKFILSNDAAFYNNFTLYLNSIAGAGAANASTTVKGIVEAATSAEINAGTATGSTGAVLAVTPDALLASNYNLTFTGLISPYAGSSAPTNWLLCDGSAVSRTTYSALFAITSTTYGVGNGSTTFNLPDLRARTPIGIGAVTKVATFASRSSNVITVTGLSNTASNEFQTGQTVLYTAASGAMTGLTTLTTYYLIRTGNLTFSLATTLANAQNGTAISLSSDGTGTQTFTLTLTTRTLGETGGEETHAMSSSELLSHNHPYNVSASGSQNGYYLTEQYAGVNNWSPNPSTNVFNPTTKGGNQAMNNMQPFLGINYIIHI